MCCGQYSMDVSLLALLNTVSISFGQNLSSKLYLLVKKIVSYGKKLYLLVANIISFGQENCIF